MYLWEGPVLKGPNYSGLIICLPWPRSPLLLMVMLAISSFPCWIGIIVRIWSWPRLLSCSGCAWLS